MKLALFGKEIFHFENRSDWYFGHANNQIKKSKYLPDFISARDGGEILAAYVQEIGPLPDGALTPVDDKAATAKKELPPAKKLKPKEVYDLKLLHNRHFSINVNPAYVDKQMEDFKEKLELVKTSDNDMQRGVQEISSILIRMENRKQYQKFQKFYDDFAYTTTAKINEVIAEHKNLKLGGVAQFMADMPQEATKAIKEYNAKTKELCGKEALFYIIADKDDFKKTDKRRDPILLAQSPFGHFWQILGAWDEEMLLLEDL